MNNNSECLTHVGKERLQYLEVENVRLKKELQDDWDARMIEYGNLVADNARLMKQICYMCEYEAVCVDDPQKPDYCPLEGQGGKE